MYKFDNMLLEKIHNELKVVHPILVFSLSEIVNWKKEQIKFTIKINQVKSRDAPIQY